MGYGVSKKMLPLIVLRVLMENANENHMLSMKQMWDMWSNLADTP